MTPSKTLFYLCIAFVVGIGLESFYNIPQAFVWGFLLFAIFIITTASFAGHKNIITIFGFTLLLLVLGITRFQMAEFSMLADPVRKFNDSPQKITLVGQVIDEPDVRDTSQKLKVRVNNTQSVILVTVGRYPEYHYLDTLELVGKLKTPMTVDDFNYQNYLMKGGIYSVMDFPKIELLLEKPQYNVVTFLYQKLLSFKQMLKKSINMSFSPPHSSIIEGIILGGTSGMSQDVKDKFSITGLTHITAISGSNIVIFSSILMTFLLALGLWRGQAFYVTVAFIWLYIVIAGFPASGLRAAIMASVFLMAQKFGRQNTSARVLVLAGAIMLVQNPRLLVYDIGFQLSFLASMGIIYGKPIIDYVLRFGKEVTKEKLNASSLLDIVSMTLAAQIFTLPIIIYYFKTMSLVAPITNLLIIPVIDWLMVFGLVSSILGIFSQTLGFIFFLPVYLVMLYVMKVIDIFGQPWAQITFLNMSWLWLVVYYFVLAALIVYLDKWQRSAFEAI